MCGLGQQQHGLTSVTRTQPPTLAFPTAFNTDIYALRWILSSDNIQVRLLCLTHQSVAVFCHIWLLSKVVYWHLVADRCSRAAMRAATFLLRHFSGSGLWLWPLSIINHGHLVPWLYRLSVWLSIFRWWRVVITMQQEKVLNEDIIMFIYLSFIWSVPDCRTEVEHIRFWQPRGHRNVKNNNRFNRYFTWFTCILMLCYV